MQIMKKKKVPEMQQERLFSLLFTNFDKRELDMNLDK